MDFIEEKHAMYHAHTFLMHPIGMEANLWLAILFGLIARVNAPGHIRVEMAAGINRAWRDSRKANAAAIV